MSEKITVFGTPYCSMVAPVLILLDRAEAPYDYVDISKNPNGADMVRQINNGNETVPTLIFPDGSTLSEPGMRALEEKLSEFGHTPPSANFMDLFTQLALNPAIRIVGLVLLLAGIAASSQGLLTAGFLLLAFSAFPLVMRFLKTINEAKE